MSPRRALPVAVIIAVCLLGQRGAHAQAPATWRLTETLRIGGGDSGPTSFNYIKSIAVDSKGRIFVYDRQAKHYGE